VSSVEYVSQSSSYWRQTSVSLTQPYLTRLGNHNRTTTNWILKIKSIYYTAQYFIPGTLYRTTSHDGTRLPIPTENNCSIWAIVQSTWRLHDDLKISWHQTSGSWPLMVECCRDDDDDDDDKCHQLHKTNNTTKTREDSILDTTTIKSFPLWLWCRLTTRRWRWLYIDVYFYLQLNSNTLDSHSL